MTDVNSDTISMTNSQHEVLTIRPDGSIDWLGQMLNTPQHVGQALAEFVRSNMPILENRWTLDGYQAAALSFAMADDQTATLLYNAAGLAGESGEVCDKIKKIVRDNNGVLGTSEVQALSKELGDTLWYIARLAGLIGLTLGDVANTNLEKLADRRARNALHGSGDER